MEPAWGLDRSGFPRRKSVVPRAVPTEPVGLALREIDRRAVHLQATGKVATAVAATAVATRRAWSVSAALVLMLSQRDLPIGSAVSAATVVGVMRIAAMIAGVAAVVAMAMALTTTTKLC